MSGWGNRVFPEAEWNSRFTPKGLQIKAWGQPHSGATPGNNRSMKIRYYVFRRGSPAVHFADC